MRLQLFIYLAICGLALVFAQDVDDDSEKDEEFQEDPEPTRPHRIVYKPPKPASGVYFVASFDTDGLEGWVESEAKKGDTDDTRYEGIWAVEEPYDQKMPGNKGLVLKSHSKHHAIATHLQRPFYFNDLPLIVQYEVHFQNGIQCGGAYLKLLSEDKELNLSKFFDKTPYTIMFGPDKCGQDYKLHFIFRHRDPVTGAYEEKHARKPDVDLQSYFIDKRPHLYTLIVRPDNSYEILIDESSVSKGNLLQDMTPPVNPPKEIDDPNHQKPEDWDDRRRIPDPESVKPPDWDEDAPPNIPDSTVMKPDGWLDEEPEYIPDPESKKPSDWDKDMDGEWEAPQIPNPLCKTAPGCEIWSPPMIPNPAYKGTWKVAMIDNPKYKGVWIPRKIPNPNYFEDPKPFHMTPISAIGLELWSVTADILFDSFILSSDERVVKQWVKDTWAQTKAAYDADGPGLIIQLILAADKRPWLWGVYVFTVALPVILFISFFWPNKRFGPPDDYYYKKTDDVQLNDEEKVITEAEPQQSGYTSHDQQDNEDTSKGMKEGNAVRKMKIDLETSAQAQGGGEPDPGQSAVETLRYRKTRLE